VEHGPDRTVLALMTGLDSYQTSVLEGARRVLGEHGYSLLAHVQHGAGAQLPESLTCLLRHHRPCGVITTNPLLKDQDEARRRLLDPLDLPTVHIGQDVPGEPCVRADNGQGMTALMAHLLDEWGARRPVLVRGMAHQPDHVDREAAFRREVARRGLTVDEGLVIDGESEAPTARERLRRLLQHRRDLDAVVTMDDWSAFAAQETLAEAGLRVPEDVAVTGFDDFPIASLTWPGLTTVEQDLTGQGATAAHLLLAGIAGERSQAHVLTPCRVVVRGSTASSDVTTAPGVPTVPSVARSARLHLGLQNALTRISCALNQCRSVDEVRDALASWLHPLGVRRFFLVAFEGRAQEPGPDGVRHRTSRLLLDYRDGRAHPAAEQAFSSCHLLPDELRGELSAGYLALQPLDVPSGLLGYVLAEYPHGPVPIARALQLDLARTLEAIFSRRDLEAHLAELEQLIAIRTSELEAEVAQRRQAQQRLQQSNAELKRSLALDGLTLIANRTAFQRNLEEQWSRRLEDAGSLALVMLDVDVFKAYNDRYGHLLGDDALRVVASCLQGARRDPDDLACRFGGEEFVLLLPDARLDDAIAVAERVRELLAAAAIPHEASPVSSVVTASLGICAVRPTAQLSPDLLVGAADDALYQAKKQGRDRIAIGSLDHLEALRPGT
jgi:diguanylate cyclase (GGDEF)-like protein